MNFYDCKNHLGTSKDTNYPYLADVSVFQARKGSTKMFWKNSHSEIEFESGEFLTKKYREMNSFFKLPNKVGPRGVTKSKLDEFLEKIGPIIPKERMEFWLNLPTNPESKDLTISYDHFERTGKRSLELVSIEESGEKRKSLRRREHED